MRANIATVSSQSFCSIEQVAAVFQRHHSEIISEWRGRAADLLSDLHLDKTTITDHVPDVIAEIIRDLALSREGPLSAEHVRGSPLAHGVRRYYDGLDVGQVVAEYNLLRGAFITVAEQHEIFIVGASARIINHRIDEAVRLAVTAFAGQQEMIRHQREAEYLAFIAHDLRTPLNAVSLLTDELRERLDPKTMAETGDLFQILSRNLERLAELIRRVLQSHVTSAPAGAFKPELRTFELWPLVQRLVLDLRSLSSKHAIEVINEIPRSLSLHADAGLVSQVFQNLLVNAFEYTPRGRVVITAEADAGGVTCVVRDNGSGIPAEMLPKIFEKLATDPEKEGTGLGLAIVRQIIQAHGGTVTAESTPGEGAAFTFTFPNADGK